MDLGLEMRFIHSPTFLKRSFFLARFDIPFVVMGVFFVAMAALEYLFPEGSGSGRSAVKILCGTQIVFALIVVFFSRKLYALAGWVPVSFILLWIWLSLSGIIQTNNLMGTMYIWTLSFYWYSMFVFFYIRARFYPAGLQSFLVLVFFSLFIWLLALKYSSSIIMAVRFNDRVDFLQQNYIGYYIVALFPYILMMKKKSIKIIAIALISYGAIYSLKRGAVLAFALMGISSSFLYFTAVTNMVKVGKKVISMIILWGVVIVIGGIFVHVNQEAIYDRLGEGSNREGLYLRAFNEIRKSELYEIVIGHGDRQAQAVLGGFTHNDWLMLLYDYGIVGVVLMINVYISLMWFLRKLCRLKSPLSQPLMSAFILMVCVQQYSIGLQLKTFGLIVGSIGLVVGSFYAEYRVKASKLCCHNYKFKRGKIL